MEVCIHRGSKQIGGSCIEIRARGKSLLLDLGKPLDDDIEKAVIPKSLQVTDNTLGMLISHYHIDHVGLVNQVDPIPYAIGNSSYEIMKAAGPFLREEYLNRKPSWYLEDERVFYIGPFEITPFLVDHSAYDAYCFLIKAEGKSLFYSGDFRGHGRKSSLLRRLVRMDLGEVDQLLLEGTTIGGSNHGMKTEDDIEKEMIDVFRETDGLALVNCSSQNIDRIVTVFRAAKKSGRKIIIDLYAAVILEATSNPKIPQSDWEHVELFIPYRQRVQIKQKKLFSLLERHSHHRIFPDELKDNPDNRVMIFRSSYLKDNVIANKIPIGAFIYSQWKGYLDMGDNASMMKWIKERHIPFYSIHTSGHASVETLKTLVTKLKPEKVVPIHSYHPDQYQTLFCNVEIHNDGEWWDI